MAGQHNDDLEDLRVGERYDVSFRDADGGFSGSFSALLVSFDQTWWAALFDNGVAIEGTDWQATPTKEGS